MSEVLFNGIVTDAVLHSLLDGDENCDTSVRK